MAPALGVTAMIPDTATSALASRNAKRTGMATLQNTMMRKMAVARTARVDLP